jgi:TetR/AcrR family transcriptional regulator of autoinduction and epiphytic fitness
MSRADTSQPKHGAKRGAKPDAKPEVADDGARRTKLLAAAFGVFTRYGYRKTSMDEVARAAQLSRQGLYLHFSTKDELFAATVHYALESALRAAASCLADASVPIQERLSRGFDAWIGRYVGVIGESASDLAEACTSLAGKPVAEHEEAFVELVGKALRSAGASAAYKAAGISTRQLARTLYATARGLKCSCGSRSEFADEFAVAVRVICAGVSRTP